MLNIARNLKRAREAEPMSKEQYSAESWALGTIKGYVSFWADLHDYRGNLMNGHQRNNWAKEVLNKIIELDKIFKEDKNE
tara:strand:- start:355 stop:594 length:240 start_codon:yes stop_codon:yes gene_type:complete